jgi:threonine dehydrogenase-like Zn-dependent dehydrogenase
MKTIVLEKPGSFQLADTEVPGAPRPGEALVRVRRVGICGSDLHAFRGKQPFFSYPRIVGHELGVEVLALGGDVSHLAVGDRCAVEPYLNCGRCIACRRSKTIRDTELHRRELTLLRSRNATGADFAWAIQMVEEGKIDPGPWITHRAPAERMVAEFPSWLDPERGVIKAVVEF